MNRTKHFIMHHPSVLLITICLFVSISKANSQKTSGTLRDRDGNSYHVRTMPDGKKWMVANLKTSMPGSFCYDNLEEKCQQSGRLYTWQSALEGCKLLGTGWHLPTNAEWRQMVKWYGGVYDDSKDSGKAAYRALITGGRGGFNAVFGGMEDSAGMRYSRGGAHGFYWTATETDSLRAWFYNFGKNGKFLNHHSDGEKQMAISVRCVREN